MIHAEHAGVPIMQKYFELEAMHHKLYQCLGTKRDCKYLVMKDTKLPLGRLRLYQEVTFVISYYVFQT